MEDLGLEGCTQSTHNSGTGYAIASYTWLPDGGAQNARGTVLLVHGMSTWTGYDYLALDDSNARRQLAGSLVETLTGHGLVVRGYDAPGHGLSSGLRAYVDSFDELRQILQEMVDGMKAEYSDLPIVLVGMSMGAMTCVLASLEDSKISDGVVLLSPAVHTPKNMLGWYGTLLRAVNRPLSWLIPRVKAIELPKNLDKLLAEQFTKDDLCYTEAMRVRMGSEFLRVYEILDKLPSVTLPKVLVLAGANDRVVNTEGVQKFFDRIATDEKKLEIHEDVGHELLHEATHDRVYEQVVEWVLHVVRSK